MLDKTLANFTVLNLKNETSNLPILKLNGLLKIPSGLAADKDSVVCTTTTINQQSPMPKMEDFKIKLRNLKFLSDDVCEGIECVRDLNSNLPMNNRGKSI